MRVALHLTVEVDPAAWAKGYDIDRKDVRADVRRYVEVALTNVEMPRCATLQLKPEPLARTTQTPAAQGGSAERPRPHGSDATPVHTGRPDPTPGRVGGTPAGPAQLGRAGPATTTPAEGPAHDRPRPGDATTGAPATPGGRETGEPTPGGPHTAQRGGEARAASPRPQRTVLAGAESRHDSGPATLPAAEGGPGCRTAAGRPGPHGGTVAALTLRPAVPPAPVRIRSHRAPGRPGRLVPALLAAALAAVGSIAAAPTALIAGWVLLALGLVLAGTGLVILGAVPPARGWSR